MMEMMESMKQKKLAVWVQVVILVAGLMMLLLLAVILPSLANDILHNAPELYYMYWPSMAFVWVTAAPFYCALIALWQVCDQISQGNAFCTENVKNLSFISKLALTECVLYFGAIAALLRLDLLHPGIFLLIAVILCIGFFIAVVAAVLSLLAQRAQDMQDENDLTI